MAEHDSSDDTCTCKRSTTSKIALPLQTPSFRIKYLSAELESGEGSLPLEGEGGETQLRFPRESILKSKRIVEM